MIYIKYRMQHQKKNARRQNVNNLVRLPHFPRHLALLSPCMYWSIRLLCYTVATSSSSYTQCLVGFIASFITIINFTWISHRHCCFLWISNQMASFTYARTHLQADFIDRTIFDFWIEHSENDWLCLHYTFFIRFHIFLCLGGMASAHQSMFSLRPLSRARACSQIFKRYPI